MYTHPLVSICIPTFNHASTLADAIDSARAQTYKNIEILIADNHSMDSTAAIAQGAASGDARISYLRQAENLGLGRNFSACIARARGEFIKFLCDDDMLAPECVASLVPLLVANDRVALAACARQFVGDDLVPIRVAALRNHSTVIDGARMARECFAFGNRIGEPTAVLFRRRDAMRGFDARYEQAVDLDMWIHLMEKGSLAFLSEPLCSVRQHAGQASRANIRTGRVVEDKRLMFREMAPRYRARLSWLEKYAWDARMASSVARARRSGGTVDTAALSEVFHGKTFRHVLLPLAAIAWASARRTDS